MLWIIRRPILAILVAVILFVIANLGLSHFIGLRLDLTEEKLFTLSDGSKEILADLGERPIQVNLYYSAKLGKEIPAYGAFAGRVRDMLKEFEAASNGGLSFREIDPKPYSMEEDEAVEHGMEGLPLDSGGDKVYFGMAAVYSDEADSVKGSLEGEGPTVAAIPFFQSERETFLEYDLMKTLYTLNNPDLPVVGVITEAPLFGNPVARMQGVESQSWAAIGQAGDFFQFEEILDPADVMNVGPDILLVAHPGNLHDDMQYAIEQFMMRGGKAVFMLDPWFESKGAGSYAPDRSDGSVSKLFDKWGISIEEKKVIGDRQLGRQVNGGQNGEVFPAPYVVWLEPKAQNLNQSDPMLADVENLILPSPGAIQQHSDSSLVMESLITSSPDAAFIDIEKLRMPNVMELLEDFEQDEDAPYVVAARFKGHIETAFPNGAPPLSEDAQQELEEARREAVEKDEPVPEEPDRFPSHKESSDNEINIIVISDVDFMADRFWVRVQEFFGQQMLMPFGDNGAFMLAMLESLNGSGELMSLRSRGISSRPFERIEEIQTEAEMQFRERERELSARLIEIEQQLAQLQNGNGADANLLGAQSENSDATITSFTDDMLAIRAELRQVNLALRQDIENLEERVRFFNIVFLPVILAVWAVIAGVLRRRKYR